MTWTEELDRLLIYQVRTGRSMLEISNASFTIFGRSFTRNAISGRIWRIRNRSGDETIRAGASAGRVAASRRTPEERAEAEKKARVRNRLRGGWYYAKLRAQRKALLASSANASDNLELLQSLGAIPKPKPKPEVLPAGMNEHGVVCCEAVTIHDLRDGACHWPLWQTSDPYDFDEIKYCGNTCTGVYCAAHKHIGYWIGRRRRTPEQRAMAVRLHHRFSENGGQNIGRAA